MPIREVFVYRPNDPRSNENGLLPRSLAEPLVHSKDPRFMVMSDIAPYQSVAADVNGKQVLIGGRRQHREFLARNKYNEVGNEMPTPRREELSREDRISDIKRAMRD